MNPNTHHTHHTHHLSMEQLADYLEGDISSAEARHIEGHLAMGCSTCQDDLTWLSETQTVMGSDYWADPPDELVAAVKRDVPRTHRTSMLVEPPAILIAGVKRAPPHEPKRTTPKRSWRIFRPNWRWAAATTAIVVLLLFGTLLVQTWQHQVVPQTASLTEFNGQDVIVQRAGEPISIDAPLQARDVIQTDNASTATLDFFDGYNAHLEPNARVGIGELSAQRDGNKQLILLDQALGPITYDIEPPPETDVEFHIETLTPALITGEGVFTVNVTADNETLVTVETGTLTITAQGESITAREGQSYPILPGKPPPIQSGHWIGTTSNDEGCIHFDVVASSTIRDLFITMPNDNELVCKQLSDVPIENNDFELTSCQLIGSFTSSTEATIHWLNRTWFVSPATSALKCS